MREFEELGILVASDEGLNASNQCQECQQCTDCPCEQCPDN